jgi:hypothetical protein
MERNGMKWNVVGSGSSSGESERYKLKVDHGASRAIVYIGPFFSSSLLALRYATLDGLVSPLLAPLFVPPDIKRFLRFGR